MLLRAFGPVAGEAPEVEGRTALAVCRRFEVAARVAARCGGSRLAAELGDEAAEGFAHARRRAAANGVRLVELVRQVAAVAAELAVPLVLLKFAALEASGLVAVGWRDACDIDLLVPAARAGELAAGLHRCGFKSSPLPRAEHQLPALAHPAGGAVELHTLLPGVRPAGRRSATFEDLSEGGWLVPVEGLPGRVAAPSPEVMAAHLIVHGLGQHGWWPESYSLLKMLGDLIDLGRHRLEREVPEAADRPVVAGREGKAAALAAGAAGSAPGSATKDAGGGRGSGHPPRAGAVAGLISRDVSSAEVAAVFRLCSDLVAGEHLLATLDPMKAPRAAARQPAGVPGAESPDRSCEASPTTPSPTAGERSTGAEAGQGTESDARVLLRHILAGRLDPAYASSLRLGVLRSQPSDRRPAVRLGRALLGTVFLSRAQVDAIYGPPRHRLGYLGRRLARPFDLLLRLARYGTHALQLRRRP